MKTRAEYLAGSLSRRKPWEADGISRRQWERRRKSVASTSQVPADVASPSQVHVASPRVAADATLESCLVEEMGMSPEDVGYVLEHLGKAPVPATSTIDHALVEQRRREGDAQAHKVALESMRSRYAERQRRLDELMKGSGRQ